MVDPCQGRHDPAGCDARMCIARKCANRIVSWMPGQIIDRSPPKNFSARKSAARGTKRFLPRFSVTLSAHVRAIFGRASRTMTPLFFAHPSNCPPARAVSSDDASQVEPLTPSRTARNLATLLQPRLARGVSSSAYIRRTSFGGGGEKTDSVAVKIGEDSTRVLPARAVFAKPDAPATLMPVERRETQPSCSSNL